MSAIKRTLDRDDDPGPAPIVVGLLYSAGEKYPIKICDSRDGTPIGRTTKLTVIEEVGDKIRVTAEFVVSAVDCWPKGAGR